MNNLTGSWADGKNNTANIADDSGNLTFTATSSGGSSGNGSWLQGVSTKIDSYSGEATFGGPKPLKFCVAKSLKEIGFSNGVVWTKQAN